MRKTKLFWTAELHFRFPSYEDEDSSPFMLIPKSIQSKMYSYEKEL